MKTLSGGRVSSRLTRAPSVWEQLCVCVSLCADVFAIASTHTGIEGTRVARAKSMASRYTHTHTKRKWNDTQRRGAKTFRCDAIKEPFDSALTLNENDKNK